MAFLTKPFATYVSGAAVIAKGTAVKFGADRSTVVPCTASTDLCIGIAQSVVPANPNGGIGDEVEVVHAHGAKALAQAAMVFGDRLGVNASGKVQKVAAQGDQQIGFALDNAAAGDIVSIFVAIAGPAYASQA